MTHLSLCLLLPLAGLLSTGTAPVRSPQVPGAPGIPGAPGLEAAQAGGGAEEAARLFRGAGIELELEARRLSIPVRVVVRNELLEFLLTAPHGAMHETLFETTVDVEFLNAALLALGLEAGRDASWEPLDPPPSEEELAAGARPYEVVLPEGDALFLYAGWRVGEESYFFRVEDLLRNLRTQRSMERHAWTYLGSRMVETRQGEVFAAAAEGNLINITFFKGGSSALMTAAVEDCADQTLWLANAWLLPPTGSEVRLFVSRERLDGAPLAVRELLPEVDLEAGIR